MAKAKTNTITVVVSAAAAQAHIEAAQAEIDARTPVEGMRALVHRQIKVGGANPRKHFDEGSLAVLAENIAEHGLLENLVVRPAQDDEPFTYELVAGERRWRAIGLLIEAGRWGPDAPIHCLVKALDDGQHRALALIENLQRKDLRPLEEAAALKDLIDLTGASTADVAVQIGFTQRFVQQRLQLLELSEADQTRLNDGKINIEEARRILASRPPPFDMPPEQQLVFLEICDRLVREEQGIYGYLNVDCAMLDWRAEGHWFVAFERQYLGHQTHDYDTGLERQHLGYQVRRPLEELTGKGDLDGDAIAAKLTEVRAALDLPALEPGVYSTPWLNAPFTATPERLEAAEQRRIDFEERDRRGEEDRKARAERGLALLELRQAEEARARALAAQGAPAAPPPEVAQAAMTLVGHALPWALNHRDFLVDADGGVILAGSTGYSNEVSNDHVVFRTLIMTAMNATIGAPPVYLEAPAEDPDGGEDDEGDDDDDFGDEHDFDDDDNTGDFDDGDDDDLDAAAPPAGDAFSRQIRQAAAEVAE